MEAEIRVRAIAAKMRMPVFEVVRELRFVIHLFQAHALANK